MGEEYREIDSTYEFMMQSLEAKIAKIKPAAYLIEEIVHHPHYNVRQGQQPAFVQEYAQTMIEQSREATTDKDRQKAIMTAFDPILAAAVDFEEGGQTVTKKVLIAGDHRLAAHKVAYDHIDPHGKMRREVLVIVVRDITREQAVYLASRDNLRHGAAMTKDDWGVAARAILLANPQISTRVVSARLGYRISHMTVSRIKNELLNSQDLTQEQREEAKKFAINSEGKKVKINVAHTEPQGRPMPQEKEYDPKERDWKPVPSKPFTPPLEMVTKNKMIEAFVEELKLFSARIGVERALFQIPVKWVQYLEDLPQILLDSRPAKTCNECKGDGCGACNESGFIPMRDCYPEIR